jgi:hypothetical protein
MWLTPGSALKVKMEVFAMSDTEVYSDWGTNVWSLMKTRKEDFIANYVPWGGWKKVSTLWPVVLEEITWTENRSYNAYVGSSFLNISVNSDTHTNISWIIKLEYIEIRKQT